MDDKLMCTQIYAIETTPSVDLNYYLKLDKRLVCTNQSRLVKVTKVCKPRSEKCVIIILLILISYYLHILFVQNAS